MIISPLPGKIQLLKKQYKMCKQIEIRVKLDALNAQYSHGNTMREAVQKKNIYFGDFVPIVGN